MELGRLTGTGRVALPSQPYATLLTLYSYSYLDMGYLPIQKLTVIDEDFRRLESLQDQKCHRYLVWTSHMIVRLWRYGTKPG